MKKFFLLPVLFFLMACGGGSSSKTEESKKEEAKTDDLSKNPDYQKGLELISNPSLDCFTCHAIEDKLNGPPYREVANKYAGMPDTIVTHLAKKIISGGSGVWGEIMMTPHPALSQADAEAIVKYILLLKKKS
jgi:cytochrome c